MKKPAKRYNKHEFQTYTDQIINGIIVMIGDSNMRLRVNSAESVQQLAKHNDIGPNILSKNLLKNFNNKRTHSKRHMEARTMIVYDLLMAYGIGNSGVP
jgi:hypothetical protein